MLVFFSFIVLTATPEVSDENKYKNINLVGLLSNLIGTSFSASVSL